MSTSIAFVGLGAMGSAMATRLVLAQMRVVGYDVRPTAVAALAEKGGHGAASVADAARGAGAIVIMTVNADQADDVLFAKGGLEALAPGATVIVTATCPPSRIVGMAARVEASGRHFVDAPVSGGVSGATQGTLSIMVAAKRDVFERARPILAALGSNLFHLGEKPGQGAAMKVVNQLLCGVHIAAAAEGLAFAERAGIDPAKALEILSGSAAQSWMLRNRGERMIGTDPSVTSAVDIFVKDLGLVLEAGGALRMGLPLASAAHQLFLAASGMGLGTRDDSQVIATYRALAPAKDGKS